MEKSRRQESTHTLTPCPLSHCQWNFNLHTGHSSLPTLPKMASLPINYAKILGDYFIKLLSFTICAISHLTPFHSSFNFSFAGIPRVRVVKRSLLASGRSLYSPSPPHSHQEVPSHVTHWKDLRNIASYPSTVNGPAECKLERCCEV